MHCKKINSPEKHNIDSNGLHQMVSGIFGNGHFIFGLSIVLELVKEMVTNGLTGTNVIFIIARVVFQKRDGWWLVKEKVTKVVITVSSLG